MGLQEDEVTAISENRNGELLFGHNYGISITNLKEYSKIHFENFNKPRIIISRVLDIQSSRKSDKIYFVSLQNGVGIIKHKNLVGLESKEFRVIMQFIYKMIKNFMSLLIKGYIL